jgi:hypothetical protein
MAQTEHTPHFVHLEGAMTVLFCLVDDAYATLNPEAGRSESLERLSDSELITLALFQQLRGIESERSFLLDAQRFFSGRSSEKEDRQQADHRKREVREGIAPEVGEEASNRSPDGVTGGPGEVRDREAHGPLHPGLLGAA